MLMQASRQERLTPDGGTAYVDVTNDRMIYHAGAGRNLPAPAPYVDVTGIDPLQPAYMGMTIEQWRAHKRLVQFEEEALFMDEMDIGDTVDE